MLKPVHLCFTTNMWRDETNAGSGKRTLNIYEKETTQKLARRQRLDACGTTAVPQSVISQNINGLIKGLMVCLCLCAFCICNVPREGMCEKSD